MAVRYGLRRSAGPIAASSIGVPLFGKTKRRHAFRAVLASREHRHGGTARRVTKRAHASSVYTGCPLRALQDEVQRKREVTRACAKVSHRREIDRGLAEDPGLAEMRDAHDHKRRAGQTLGNPGIVRRGTERTMRQQDHWKPPGGHRCARRDTTRGQAVAVRGLVRLHRIPDVELNRPRSSRVGDAQRFVAGSIPCFGVVLRDESLRRGDRREHHNANTVSPPHAAHPRRWTEAAIERLPPPCIT